MLSIRKIYRFLRARDSFGLIGSFRIYALYANPIVDSLLKKRRNRWRPKSAHLITIFRNRSFEEIHELQKNLEQLSKILSLPRKEVKKYSAELKRMGFCEFAKAHDDISFTFQIADKPFRSGSTVKISGTPKNLVVTLDAPITELPNFDVRIIRLHSLMRHYRFGLDRILIEMNARTEGDCFFIDLSDGGILLSDEVRASANLFAFTRRREYVDVGLLPDAYTLLDLDSEADMKMNLTKEEARQEYSQRVKKIFWRGSSSGLPVQDELTLNKRIQFCIRSLNHPDEIDSKISRIVQISRPIRAWLKLRSLGVFAPAVLEDEFGKYQAYIDLDGNSSAWGTLRKYLRVIHVIRFHTEYEMFYHVNQPANTLTEIADEEEFFKLLPNSSKIISNFDTAWSGYLFAQELLKRISEGNATIYPMKALQDNG